MTEEANEQRPDIEQLAHDLEVNKQEMRETLGYSLDEFCFSEKHLRPSANFAEEMLQLIDTTLEPFEASHLFNKIGTSKPYFENEKKETKKPTSEAAAAAAPVQLQSNPRTVKFNGKSPIVKSYKWTPSPVRKVNSRLIGKFDASAGAKLKSLKSKFKKRKYSNDLSSTMRRNSNLRGLKKAFSEDERYFLGDLGNSRAVAVSGGSTKDVNLKNSSLSSLINKFGIMVDKYLLSDKSKKRAGDEASLLLMKTRIPIKKGSNLVYKISSNMLINNYRQQQRRPFTYSWLPFILDENKRPFQLNYCLRSDLVEENYNRIFKQMKETDEQNKNLSKILTFNRDQSPPNAAKSSNISSSHKSRQIVFKNKQQV
jgi:hypothetical protein